MFQLEVDGLEGWVPIRTDISGRKLEKDLRGRIPKQDKSAFPLLANLAASVIERDRLNAAPPLLALWARIEDPRQIVPVCIAQLHMMPVEPDSTPESYAADLVSGTDLQRPYVLEELPTASGEAYRLEAILDLGEKQVDQGGHRFHRSDMVFWIRPDREEGMVLSTQTTDLVRGVQTGQELAQLAAGVRWG